MLLSVFSIYKEHNSLVKQDQLLSDYYAQTYTVKTQELEKINSKIIEKFCKKNGIPSSK